MPRYLVERHFPDGLGAFLAEHSVPDIASAETEVGVVWLHSFVADGACRMFCLCDADSPESVRKAARRAGLPIDVIHRVTVLDPNSFPDSRAQSLPA